MRTRKGNCSEGFWPSLVMKKWLNIKPKVYDFSEDEYTETGSEEDACSLKDEGGKSRNDINRTEDYQSKSFGDNSDAPPKSKSLKHRLGKSETLRAQHINKKDVSVTIASWNVAGRLPNEDLEIDQWLRTDEPADIYVIGFQEVVPLNAGNVLGAESSRPIPIWEDIIRRTLNKSSQPERKHKCCSTPPSPVLWTSSVADELADAVDVLPLEIMNQEYAEAVNTRDPEGRGLSNAIDIGKKLHLKRIYGIDCDSRIDWPKRSSDATPQGVSSNCKLRKVLSSSGRMRFSWKQNPLMYSPRNFAPHVKGIQRSHHSFSNLGLAWREQQVRPDDPEVPEMVQHPLSDESDAISEAEEATFLELIGEPTTDQIINERKKSHPQYVRVVGKQMVGIYVSIWTCKKLRRHVSNLKVSPVGIGLMGYMGNKGSVSVSMSLFQARLCFVCCHLTSGQKDAAQQRRNANVSEIIRRTCFSSILDTNQPHTIPSHDQIFWFGDLNYRLNMLDSEIRKLVALKQWDQLMVSDELIKELQKGHVFDGWQEGVINFPPTYKYEMNSDRYVGETPKEGEKRRSPAWCDRILWFGNSIKQLFYNRAEMQLSDHRPVSSMFMIEVEVFDHRKQQKAIIVSSKKTAVHPEVFLTEYNGNL